MQTVTVITVNGIVKDLIGLPDGYYYRKVKLNDDHDCECDLHNQTPQVPYEWNGTIWCLSCGNFIRYKEKA